MRKRVLGVSSGIVLFGLFALTGCTIPGSGFVQPEGTRTPTAQARPTAPASPTDAPWITLTFEAGASLTQGTPIDWANGFGDGSEWTRIPKASTAGSWAYANADNSCVAMFYQRTPAVLGDLGDRESSDATIKSVLDDDFLPGLAIDARTELARQQNGDVTTRGGIVEYRRYLAVDGDHGVFVAARAFHQAGIALVTQVDCNAADIESVADEVLSNNVMAIGL